ncbi:MAG: phage portal protein [Tabrizicola sp.]|nr:phage portal protein [Tabrizicola sp.]
MRLFDLFRRSAKATLTPRATTFNGFTDPAFLEYVRSGGASVTIEGALKNSTVLRCLDLIGGAIGSLPLVIQSKDSVGEVRPATDHPLYNLFMYRPNPFQTAFEFKQLMQVRLLAKGNAYARIVLTGKRVSSLVPITGPVEVVENWDGTLSYRVQQRQNSTQLKLGQDEVFHLRSLSLDGVEGLSRVEMAADIITTALSAQVAATRIFDQGMMAGGWLKHKAKLSKEAVGNIQRQVQENMSGVRNAGRWLVLEEDMQPEPIATTAEQSQLAETRAAQVEEIGRVFGVPRPLLFVDDTSWGSGIEQLAILFVRFGLAPWFKCWEDAITRSLLTQAEWGKIVPDFDERELLRGTLKDQGEFFAKASGAGGHRPWMETNEIRSLSGLGPHKDGFGLVPAGGNQNVAS